MTSETQLREWAERVKAHRKKLKLSQEKFARVSGRSLSYIQKIENAVKGNEDIVNELLAVGKSAKKRRTAA